jgi:hypothetical protein
MWLSRFRNLTRGGRSRRRPALEVLADPALASLFGPPLPFPLRPLGAGRRPTPEKCRGEQRPASPAV